MDDQCFVMSDRKDVIALRTDSRAPFTYARMCTLPVVSDTGPATSLKTQPNMAVNDIPGQLVNAGARRRALGFLDAIDAVGRVRNLRSDYALMRKCLGELVRHAKG